MTFKEAKSLISNLSSSKWKYGLERIEAFLVSAGLQDSVRGPFAAKYIHVAGTNGKGSVVAYLQSMLTEQGWKTGAFFSPHVFNIRERIQLNGSLISEQEFIDQVQFVQAKLSEFNTCLHGNLTEFEFKTVMGFSYWKKKFCEWIALEVGMGGKYDATNIVDPIACVITSISYDHTNILGNTLCEIAYQKAGIIKYGKPVIIGHMGAAPLETIQRVAHEMEAPVWIFGRDIKVLKSPEGDSYKIQTPHGTFYQMKTPHLGTRQIHNLALSVAAMDISGAIKDKSKLATGALKAYLPGRYQKIEYRGVEIILDGAHNEDSARALVEIFSQGSHENSVILLTGMLRGHNYDQFYNIVSQISRQAHFVPVDTLRGCLPSELEQKVGLFFDQTQVHSDVRSALDTLLDSAKNRAIILVTGSFYLVGEVWNLVQADNKLNLPPNK